MHHDKNAPALDSALVWFRRDLRAHDHAALFHALKAARQVWCVFVFDRDILDALGDEVVADLQDLRTAHTERFTAAADANGWH